MYQTFRINRDTGTLATAATPPELVEEKVFIVYPERAADWARENEISCRRCNLTIRQSGGACGRCRHHCAGAVWLCQRFGGD